MHNLLVTVSGICDVLLLVFLFLWIFEFARIDKQPSQKRHYGPIVLILLVATAGLMYVAFPS
ncbi:hypothetical protein [Lentilactobacillus sp. Marseille-Q4993]|uniref:hypothetical protein n=1 Tax=Lentilactobacillus sp. Marseille-Q4993 TaxID=3039492 RepID=UPI0024BC740E|nr:hypothetical protein [Lentilactobacillus sp. Marseille-Q4993]